ncbi:MAG: MFS transporter [Propionibacteriaceae bacterium]|nr:MFS transporter [Propionibacteriaceae bacterium]
MRSYLEVLAIPGAKRFCGAGLITRFANSMVGIAVTLLVSGLYSEYALAGQVVAAMTIAGAVCAPLVAGLIDRLGQARVGHPLIGSYVVAAVALVVCASFRLPGPVLCLIAAVMGVTVFRVGAMVRARWTHLLGATPALQPAFALESMFDDVAFVLGPTIATVVSTLAWPGLGPLPQAGVGLIVLVLLGGGLTFLGQRQSEPPVRRRPAGQARPRPVIARPGVLVLAVAFIGVGVQFGSNGIAMVAVCEALGTKWAAAPIMAVGSTASMLGALWYGSRPWRKPLAERFVIGVVLVAGPAILFLLAHQQWSLAIVSALSGLAISPTFITGNSLMARLVPASSLTEGLTWIDVALSIGLALGSAGSGWMIDHYGPHSGYWVLAVGAVMAMLIVLACARSLSRHMRRADQAAASAAAELATVPPADAALAAEAETAGPA